jgi:GTPase SAR1 family protein
LKNTTQLTGVFLDYSPFECHEDEFPFDALVNLECLSVIDTNMKAIPCEIGRVTELKHLICDRNELTRLPKEICSLPSATSVHFQGNPLSSLPCNVCPFGMQSIKSYFQSLEGASAVQRARRNKLIVHGKSGSGKSSLVRAIQLYLKGIDQDACVNEEDSIIGIDQHNISLEHVDLVVLDYGGQHSYSPISQLFISNKCLVIITADATEYAIMGELAFRRLSEPYLQRIYDYVKVAVVLPVITKADLVTDEEANKVASDLGQRLLKFEKERTNLIDVGRKQNPVTSTERQGISMISKKPLFRMQEKHELDCLSNVMFTSARTAVGINNLVHYVNRLIVDRTTFPEVVTLLPSSWVKSEDQLLLLAKTRSPPICSLTATYDAIVPFGLFQENAQSLLSYLHAVGSICHYDQYPSLRQQVFLQPQFVTDVLKAVYHHQLKSVLTMDSIPIRQQCLVTRHELEGMLTTLSENGVASVKLLQLIWSRSGFKEEHNNLMVKLLVSFNFAYVRCDNEHVITTVNALVQGNVDEEDDDLDLLSLLREHYGELFLP